MKYLCWISADRLGGCEEYALRLVRHLHALGWEVAVVCSHERMAREFQKRLNIPEVVFHRSPVPAWVLARGFKGWRETIELVFWLKFFLTHRADVAHAPLPWHEYGLPMIRACAWLGQPLLVTFQLVGPEHPPRPQAVRQLGMARRRGVKFCAVSEQNRRLLREYYGFTDAEIPVIPNRCAMDSTERPGAAERKQTRGKLDLSDASKMILTVGGLRHQKGHDLIVRSIPEIVRAFPGAIFVWAGDGELREELTRMAEANGVRDKLLLLGHRHDVRQLLGAADLFLFPSRWEGESFAVIEAAALETPVAASAASGIPELLRDGKDAWLFPVEDEAGLIRAVVASLSDPAEAARRAKSARQRVTAYTEDDMFRDTVGLLQRVVGKS
jgi:glycosyltransferase involved in cell wall biosynthesis